MSESKVAREKLTKLEKASGPSEEYLEQAYKFIGIRIQDLDRPNAEVTKLGSFGREEWLLKWLLKRLQTQDGDNARKEPLSWRLLAHLFRSIPVTNLARILSEKKFLSVLKQSLESVRNLEDQSSFTSTTSQTLTDGHQDVRVSKKRKLNGEVLKVERHLDLQDWMDSVYAAVNYLVESGNSTGAVGLQEEASIFSAEYIKTVLRTSAEESADILGSWLILCGRLTEQPPLKNSSFQVQLLAFIEIWQHHIIHSEELVLFSLHCCPYILSLLQKLRRNDFPRTLEETQLEQLLARMIIMPAKSNFLDDHESELLGTLTRVSVLQSPTNASILFDVAIRSVTGSKPRNTQDAAWLRKAFSTFNEAMLHPNLREHYDAMGTMLQAAIDHKVELDITILRGIFVNYCIQDKSAHWSIVSMLMELDANLFLIPDKKENVLAAILSRITKTLNVNTSWSEADDKVVRKVVVPLMKAFAKARDLSQFIRHWYAQLVEVDSLRRDSRGLCVLSDSAWESHHLQEELRHVFESSLTSQQIHELLDWLAANVDENPGPVSVLLEAIAGSLTLEDVIDTVGLRLYHVMFDGEAFGRLDEHHKARAWRILTQILPQLPVSQLGKVALLWEQGAKPFDELPFDIVDSITDERATLGSCMGIRCACVAWIAAPRGSTLETLSKPIVVGLLKRLASGKWGIHNDLETAPALSNVKVEERLTTAKVNLSKSSWLQLCAIVDDHPRILLLASELASTQAKELLQYLIWSASIVKPTEQSQTSQTWLKSDRDIFARIWSSVWSIDELLNDLNIIDLYVDTMLRKETYPLNLDHDYISPERCDILAVRTFLELPIEVLPRRHRERMMQRWSFQSNACSSIVQPAVLSLKIKLLQCPTFYEGMSFSDLLALIPLIDADESLALPAVLELLKEIVRLTIAQLGINLDQPRSRNYFIEALETMKTMMVENRDKVCSPALFTILQPLLVMLGKKENVFEELGITTHSEAVALQNSSSELASMHLKRWISRLHSRERYRGATYDAVLCVSIMDIYVDPLNATEMKAIYDIARSYLAQRAHLTTEANGLEMPPDADILDLSTQPQLKLASGYGRHLLTDAAESVIVEGAQRRSEMLITMLGPDSMEQLTLEALFTVREMIQSYPDFRNSKADDTAIDESPLLIAYFGLCRALQRNRSIRQFCMISEILNMMLKTKPHAISQWSIDTTLSTITLICSRQGPHLHPAHSGIIYLHLCSLLRTILLSHTHRLKLQGHYHLLLQTMQSLLRCLFLPLPHSHSTKTPASFPSTSSWLIPSHPLKAKHATSFTRLLTSICDPTHSSVSTQHRSHASQAAAPPKAILTSATEKAKKIAGQHMQFLLTLYVKGQLEMRMLPEVREKLVPGIYAILDTTTKEMRKAIGEGLDSNGRAVLHVMIQDWVKFGRWGGS